MSEIARLDGIAAGSKAPDSGVSEESVVDGSEFGDVLAALDNEAGTGSSDVPGELNAASDSLVRAETGKGLPHSDFDLNLALATRPTSEEIGNSARGLRIAHDINTGVQLQSAAPVSASIAGGVLSENGAIENLQTKSLTGSSDPSPGAVSSYSIAQGSEKFSNAVKRDALVHATAFSKLISDPRSEATAFVDSAKSSGGTLDPAAFSAMVTASAGAHNGSSITGTAINLETTFSLNHARFADGFSQQIVTMAKDGVQLAKITINPPELGPVELRIITRNDEAAVQLASPHGAVRDALEEALPRLREQFEQAGLHLSDSSVFHELPQQSANYGDADENVESTFESGDFNDETGHELGSVERGLVDAYV